MDRSIAKRRGPQIPRAVLAVRRAMLRTERGPIRPLWAAAYAAAIHALAVCLSWRERDAAVYARGTLGAGDPVYGQSDIDVAVVVPGAPEGAGGGSGRVRRRWKRLCRAFPLLRKIVDLAVYEDAELGAAATSSTFTARRPVHFGDWKLRDEGRLLVRPGLYRPLRTWRLLRGPDRRPAQSAWDHQACRIAGWLELQFRWRWAFTACCNPSASGAAYMCVKLVADPARIWLWLVHGEEVLGRREALERGLHRIPEEETALRRTLDLYRALPMVPEPPLAEALDACIRLSARLARRLAEDVEGQGIVPVRLLWDPGDGLALPPAAREAVRGLTGEEPDLLPLADWRARASPLPPDEAFCRVPLDPGSPAALAAAAAAGAAGVYPLLESDGLMILPTTRGGVLRAVQCAATDPVSFALAAGRSTADFPVVAGWSAPDSARRAAAEHAAWLGVGYPPSVREWAYGQARSTASSVHAMGRLLTAARAALFLESVEAEDPELALTTAAVARRLGETRSGARTIAEESYEAYRASRVEDRPPPARTIAALRELVLALPAYRPEGLARLQLEHRERRADRPVPAPRSPGS
jgi:hypothetical protein